MRRDPAFQMEQMPDDRWKGCRIADRDSSVIWHPASLPLVMLDPRKGPPPRDRGDGPRLGFDDWSRGYRSRSPPAALTDWSTPCFSSCFSSSAAVRMFRLMTLPCGSTRNIVGS